MYYAGIISGPNMMSWSERGACSGTLNIKYSSYTHTYSHTPSYSMLIGCFDCSSLESDRWLRFLHSTHNWQYILGDGSPYNSYLLNRLLLYGLLYTVTKLLCLLKAIVANFLWSDSQDVFLWQGPLWLQTALPLSLVWQSTSVGQMAQLSNKQLNINDSGIVTIIVNHCAFRHQGYNLFLGHNW